MRRLRKRFPPRVRCLHAARGTVLSSRGWGSLIHLSYELLFLDIRTAALIAGRISAFEPELDAAFARVAMYPRRISVHDRIRRNVLRDDRSGAHKGVLADGVAAND